jgi:hypothetical protein
MHCLQCLGGWNNNHGILASSFTKYEAVLLRFTCERLRWSSGQHAGLWYPRSRVRSHRIFFGRKKGSKAVCPVSQICGTIKNPERIRGSRLSSAKLTGYFTLEVPSFANRGLQRSSRLRAPPVGVPLHSVE